MVNRQTPVKQDRPDPMLAKTKEALEGEHGLPFTEEVVQKVLDFLRMMARMAVQQYLWERVGANQHPKIP